MQRSIEICITNEKFMCIQKILVMHVHKDLENINLCLNQVKCIQRMLNKFHKLIFKIKINELCNSLQIFLNML